MWLVSCNYVHKAITCGKKTAKAGRKRQRVVSTARRGRQTKANLKILSRTKTLQNTTIGEFSRRFQHFRGRTLVENTLGVVSTPESDSPLGGNYEVQSSLCGGIVASVMYPRLADPL